MNVGIPVPREPFAFGGLSGSLSKYGDFDVTAEGAMEFFTNRRKVRGGRGHVCAHCDIIQVYASPSAALG